MILKSSTETEKLMYGSLKSTVTKITFNTTKGSSNREGTNKKVLADQTDYRHNEYTLANTQKTKVFTMDMMLTVIRLQNKGIFTGQFNSFQEKKSSIFKRNCLL